MDESLYRKIPQISDLVAQSNLADLAIAWSHEELVAALRFTLNEIRASLKQGHTLPDFASESFRQRVESAIVDGRQPNLRPVINATGIVIHTNLGRAPLAPAAIEAMNAAAQAYANIEYDLEQARRGSRYDHTRDLIRELTKAEDAIVVNNCASAVMISLATFAAGKEVIVSRGELIEIGGSFRIPDVITQNGAKLVEVGTTNKTRLADFEKALSDETAVFLKTHTSNYRVVGFTENPNLAELASLAHQNDLLLIEDLGSGTLIDLSQFGLPHEPTVEQSIRAGADLVTFSGDKLLGGPQCGVIAGKKTLIDRLRKNPLLRAMRVDKLCLAALEATLRLYRPPYKPEQEIPVLRMLSTPIEALELAAQKLASDLNALPSINAKVEDSMSEAGGGALPAVEMASKWVSVNIDNCSANQVANILRRHQTPIIVRISDGKVKIDVRTLLQGDADTIYAAFASIQHEASNA